MELNEPTNEQKYIIRAHMLISDMWLVKDETSETLIVVYRHGKTEKHLNKNIDLWEDTKNVSAKSQ